MLEVGKLYKTNENLLFCAKGKGYFSLPKNTFLVFLENDKDMISCFLHGSKTIKLFRMDNLDHKNCKKLFHKIKE